MSIARHDSGLRAAVRALASQIHPVFMLPPVAASAFGAVLASDFSVPLAVLHMAVAFCALYTAHVKDGYVDFYGRGEDDDHPLSETGCRVALVLSSTLFFVGCAALAVLVDPIAALLSLPGWLIGYLHAPHLDMHPVSATMGYPTGIGFALVSGYYVQTTSLSAAVVAYAVVFVVILGGIKTIDDGKDYEYDRSIDKRTVAVVLGRQRARSFAYLLMGVGLVAAALFAIFDVFPPSAVAAPVAFAAVLGVARRADDAHATMLLIRGSYVFLALLVLAAWLQPLR
ncbi:UbiA family prenyltransferase [Haloferacaceae archaeon DSL9]